MFIAGGLFYLFLSYGCLLSGFMGLSVDSDFNNIFDILTSTLMIIFIVLGILTFGISVGFFRRRNWAVNSAKYLHYILARIFIVSTIAFIAFLVIANPSALFEFFFEGFRNIFILGVVIWLPMFLLKKPCFENTK